jgi:Meckel syndrome type 1 protein
MQPGTQLGMQPGASAEVPVAAAMPGTAPVPQEAAPAVLAARLAGQQATSVTAAAAAGPGVTAEAAPGAKAIPEVVAGMAMAPKAAKAAPRGGLPAAAAEAETDPAKPAATVEAVAQPLALLPPPPTHAAPKAETAGEAAPDAAPRPGGLAKPERLLAGAPTEKPAPHPARAAESAPMAEPAAPATAPTRDTAPPPPMVAPPAPPAETQAVAPPRQAPSASPAQQVAPVIVAVALGQGANGQSNGSSLTVRLNPGELGQVEVRIERPADGGAAQVKVVAERPETLALLQRDAPELGRALQQAGIQQDNCRLSFSLGSGQDQGNAPGGGAPQQGAGGQGNQGWGGRQARFVTEAIPPPRVATSLLDMSI